MTTLQEKIEWYTFWYWVYWLFYFTDFQEVVTVSQLFLLLLLMILAIYLRMTALYYHSVVLKLKSAATRPPRRSRNPSQPPRNGERRKPNER